MIFQPEFFHELLFARNGMLKRNRHGAERGVPKTDAETKNDLCLGTNDEREPGPADHFVTIILGAQKTVCKRVIHLSLLKRPQQCARACPELVVI
ncbi:hypothetical protein D3C81_1808010 [compost metagenome]